MNQSNLPPGCTNRDIEEQAGAFDEPIDDGGHYSNMSLRDYFASQALIGILGARNGFLVDVGTDNAPGWAYRVADAMIAARKDTPCS